MRSLARTLVLAALLVSARGAGADGWLVIEAPAAVPVSDPQASAFRAGLMPALGAYVDAGPAALGLRLRAGALRNGPPPDGHLSDPGMGGLGTAGLAVRLATHGLWVEGVVGGGITGRDWVPAMEAGAGWNFAVGPIELGPELRLVRVVSRASMAAFGSADLLLIGVDVRLGRSHEPRRAAPVIDVAAAAPAPPVEAEAPVVPVVRDGDLATDHEVGCATDPDGCEIAEHVFLHDDRIVLEERVLFDTDRARVKSHGRELIAAIAKVWRAHPEWLRITIEGHADVRGSDEYNQELSQRRAERVRDVFVRLGFPVERLDAVGYGRSRPRDPGSSDEAHQHNRRVEFVIDRGHGDAPGEPK